MDLTFKPIPRSCPIPRNVIAFIGGTIGPSSTYLLWLNGQEIMIKTPAIVYERESHKHDDPHWEWHMLAEAQRNFGHYLEVIQTLLASVEFGKTNWGYLLKTRYGSYSIKQKHKNLATVSCPLWEKDIYEEEIEFTVWGQAWDRRGIWQGKEVDILYAWSDDDAWRLNKSMHAYRFLAGMDLTFEVYGHLLRRDGTVIGLVSQAAKGRMIKPTDRTLIYDTVSRIQSRGALYKGCGTNRFMISPEGKVRLLELSCLWRYHQTQLNELERDAEIWHWGELDELFWEFEAYGPYGYYRLPPERFTSSHKDLKFIAPPPTIERPLGGIFLPSCFFSACRISPWDGYEKILDVGRGVAHIRSVRLPWREMANADYSEQTVEDDFNIPIPRRAIATISQSRYANTRSRPMLLFNPYPTRTTRKGPVIARSEDTESTSDL